MKTKMSLLNRLEAIVSSDLGITENFNVSDESLYFLKKYVTIFGNASDRLIKKISPFIRDSWVELFSQANFPEGEICGDCGCYYPDSNEMTEGEENRLCPLCSSEHSLLDGTVVKAIDKYVGIEILKSKVFNNRGFEERNTYGKPEPLQLINTEIGTGHLLLQDLAYDFRTDLAELLYKYFKKTGNNITFDDLENLLAYEYSFTDKPTELMFAFDFGEEVSEDFAAGLKAYIDSNIKPLVKHAFNTNLYFFVSKYYLYYPPEYLQYLVDMELRIQDQDTAALGIWSFSEKLNCKDCEVEISEGTLSIFITAEIDIQEFPGNPDKNMCVKDIIVSQRG